MTGLLLLGLVWYQKKEMGIMVGKGRSFQKSPIQEYGKRATFASFVLLATNAPSYLLYLVLLWPFSPPLLSSLSSFPASPTLLLLFFLSFLFQLHLFPLLMLKQFFTNDKITSSSFILYSFSYHVWSFLHLNSLVRLC